MRFILFLLSFLISSVAYGQHVQSLKRKADGSVEARFKNGATSEFVVEGQPVLAVGRNEAGASSNASIVIGAGDTDGNESAILFESGGTQNGEIVYRHDTTAGDHSLTIQVENSEFASIGGTSIAWSPDSPVPTATVGGVSVSTSKFQTRRMSWFGTTTAATGWSYTIELPSTEPNDNIGGMIICGAGDFGGGSSGNSSYVATIGGGQSGIGTSGMIVEIHNNLTADANFAITIADATPMQLTVAQTGPGGGGTSTRHTCQMTYTVPL